MHTALLPICVCSQEHHWGCGAAIVPQRTGPSSGALRLAKGSASQDDSSIPVAV